MATTQDTRTRSAQRKIFEDTFLQPWFVPLQIAQAIRRLLPDTHIRKMRFYFDDWGCMKCEKKGLMYGANGMCSRCAQKVQHRVVCCLRKRVTATDLVVRRPESCTRVESAKLLLRDLIR
jgi:hypothetical protein